MDPVLDLAQSESVATPRAIPPGKATAILAAAGASIGAAVAGTPGALVGGTVGWAIDTLRRKLLA